MRALLRAARAGFIEATVATWVKEAPKERPAKAAGRAGQGTEAARRWSRLKPALGARGSPSTRQTGRAITGASDALPKGNGYGTTIQMAKSQRKDVRRVPAELATLPV